MPLVFRHWTLSQPHEIYHFYSTRLSGNAWSLPSKFSMSSGHNSQHASLALSPSGGLLAAYSSDGRSATARSSDQAHALHYNVYLSSLPKGDGPPSVTFQDAALPPPTTRPPGRPRHTMTAGGKTYHLLMGDAHRHTDIRGHSGVDGSVLDTYRYAMDAAQLDWLGTRHEDERLTRAAQRVEAAVAGLLNEEKTLTYDLIGEARASRCSEVGKAIEQKLRMMA